jgi:hypothetical protein
MDDPSGLDVDAGIESLFSVVVDGCFLLGF